DPESRRMTGPVGDALCVRVRVTAISCEYKSLSSHYLPSLCLWTGRVSASKLQLTPRPRTNVNTQTLQQQFGNLIRSRRHASGIGQEALADKAGLHRTHVSLLERGKRMPSLLVVKKLAAALGTTMASLMEELEGAGEDTPASQRPRQKGKG